MKQIDQMFERFLFNKKPLRKKWQVRFILDMDILMFYHYQHLACFYSMEEKRVIRLTNFTDADKRGNQAIESYVSKNKDQILKAISRIKKNCKEGEMSEWYAL